MVQTFAGKLCRITTVTASIIQFCRSLGLIVLIVAASHASPTHLSLRARKLNEALTILKKSPLDSAAQQHYLNAFPHTYKEFLQLFDLNRELYDGYRYISVLPSLGRFHEHELGKLLIELAKDAESQADAPTYLQEVIRGYANQHTRSFADIVGTLGPSERRRLVHFMSDFETVARDRQQQEIIDSLRKLRNRVLANEFEAARAARASVKH